MSKGICVVPECGSVVHARGWCPRHYGVWRRKGTPTAESVRHYATPAEAFAARTERDGDCLIWSGCTTDLGYGLISIAGRLVMVHRYAWEAERGPIPDGIEVDHTCWNHACCAIGHLRLSTRNENMRNRNGAQSTSGTGVRNVRRQGDGFRVIVNRQHVGTFSDLDAASAAAEVARNDRFGAFAGR